LGTGQFIPNSSAKPFIGSANTTETVQELKVEMVCSNEQIKASVQALLEAHPYEVVAYQVMPFFNLDDL
jgi:hypothetical protein